MSIEEIRRRYIEGSSFDLQKKIMDGNDEHNEFINMAEKDFDQCCDYHDLNKKLLQNIILYQSGAKFFANYISSKIVENDHEGTLGTIGTYVLQLEHIIKTLFDEIDFNVENMQSKIKHKDDGQVDLSSFDLF